MKNLKFFILTPLSTLFLSFLLLALLNFIFNEDRAGVLASVLHLGNGIILAALLGGITGLWLAIGGPKRASRLAGTMIGVVVVWALWSNGGKYIWIVESFLLGVFGKAFNLLSHIHMFQHQRFLCNSNLVLDLHFRF